MIYSKCLPGVCASVLSLVLAAVAPDARAAGVDNILIDPDQESVSATSYYATFGQIPSKMADNSGLSFPLPTGTPLPVNDSAYPTHDTALIDMYRSGKDTHPDLFFSLDGAYALTALHYWNFNGDNRASHPTGGDRETPDDGINAVDIAVSYSSVAGPYTTVGTYVLQPAPVQPTYTGVTLPLGTTVAAKFVRFHVESNFSPPGPDASSYFGMSELRFIGGSQPGDANLDGVVDFKDLLVLAQNYGKTTGVTRATGDLTGDGKVDFADLLVLSQNYGRSLTSVAAPAVTSAPEPAGIALCAVAAMATLRRRRSTDL